MSNRGSRRLETPPPDGAPALIDRPLRPPLAPIVERERAGMGARVGESAGSRRWTRVLSRPSGLGGGSRPACRSSPATATRRREWRGSTRARGDSTSPPTALAAASRARCRHDERSRERFGHPFAPRFARRLSGSCARRRRGLFAPTRTRRVPTLRTRLRSAAPPTPRRAERPRTRGASGGAPGSPARTRARGPAARPRAGTSEHRTRISRAFPWRRAGASATWITIGRCANGVTGGETARAPARARARRGGERREGYRARRLLAAEAGRSRRTGTTHRGSGEVS